MNILKQIWNALFREKTREELELELDYEGDELRHKIRGLRK